MKDELYLRAINRPDAEGVLFLTNNTNTRSLYEWISRKTKANLMDDKLRLDDLKRLRPKLVVSYNYNYLIPRECIEYMNGNIINLHVSLLPWNRGFSPNIWSFIDDTPKGVTIHKMSVGLDKGEIIFQKELFFRAEEETFSSTYAKLNAEITALCKEHWDELFSGHYTAKPQVGKGSYHALQDLKDLEVAVPFSWDDSISDFLDRYHRWANA